MICDKFEQRNDLINILTAGPIISFSYFFLAQQIKRLNILKIKRDINQQDFKIVDLHFVKSE